MQCEHGAESNWWWESFPSGGGWNGPLSMCTCCGTQFGYINSANMNHEGSSGTNWTPLNRCAKCGGGMKEWKVPYYKQND